MHLLKNQFIDCKKKSLEKQISELEEKEFMTIIKANNCTVSTLNEDLKIIKLLKENNLTEQDIIDIIRELGGSNVEKETQTV